MNKQYLIVLFLILSSIFACQNQDQHVPSEMSDYDSTELAEAKIAVENQAGARVIKNGIDKRMRPNPTPSPITSSDKKSKLIKDGHITIRSEQIENGKRLIDSLVSKYDGYYQQDHYSASDYLAAYNMKIRIPSTNFERIIAAIEAGPHLLVSKNITARDVSEEYVDLEIRLKNNRAYLDKYNDLLRKANSIKDILEIQERTRQISNEIESTLGRLKFLDDRVNYSTLHINIEQHFSPIQSPNKRNFGNQIINAGRSGFNGLLDIILYLISIWPFLLIIVSGLFFRKKIFSLFKKS